MRASILLFLDDEPIDRFDVEATDGWKENWNEFHLYELQCDEIPDMRRDARYYVIP